MGEAYSPYSPLSLNELFQAVCALQVGGEETEEEIKLREKEVGENKERERQLKVSSVSETEVRTVGF